jgi:hypothetical protein
VEVVTVFVVVVVVVVDFDLLQEGRSIETTIKQPKAKIITFFSKFLLLI